MPFIWDNFEWMLVSDEDPYDKSRFVVARKILVKPVQLNVFNEVFSIEPIRRYFRRFGEIESIEILPNNEAHVTYQNDRSAYHLHWHHELRKKLHKVQPYQVEPVNTWEQPSQKVNSPSEEDMEIEDEEATEIFMLTEECLLHLFRFLDIGSLVNMADVCKMFNRLLHQYTFPCIQEYLVSCDSKLKLAQMRRELLCIGRHITDFSFTFDYVEEENGHLIYKSRLPKFLKLIAQNVGQNIRRAYFKFGSDRYNTLEYESIVVISPILQNLESLQIVDSSLAFDSFEIDFPALCPNLIELKVNMDVPMVTSCQPWPSLICLSTIRNCDVRPKTLMSIIEHNPQLKSLTFGVYNGNYRAVFTAITKRLPGLERLAIDVNEWDTNNFTDDYFNRLEELQNLGEIILRNLNKGSLTGVIDHLSSFTNLRQIVLIDESKHSEVRNYDQSLVNLVMNLSHLERLKLVNVPMKEETLVEIVRYGHKLKMLRIVWRELIFSNKLIFKLVDVLKCSGRQSDEALQLLLSRRDFDKLDVSKSKEIERYLQLKYLKR